MDVNDAAVLSAARLQLTEHFLCRNAVRLRRPCGGVRGRQMSARRPWSFTPIDSDEWCRATLHHSRRRHARRPGLRSAPGLRWKLAARRQRRQPSPGTIAVTSNGKQPPAHLSLVQPTNNLLVLGRLHQLLQSPFLLSNTGVPGVYTFIRTAAHRMGGGGVVLTCPSVCALWAYRRGLQSNSRVWFFRYFLFFWFRALG